MSPVLWLLDKLLYSYLQFSIFNLPLGFAAFTKASAE